MHSIIVRTIPTKSSASTAVLSPRPQLPVSSLSLTVMQCMQSDLAEPQTQRARCNVQTSLRRELLVRLRGERAAKMKAEQIDRGLTSKHRAMALHERGR